MALLFSVLSCFLFCIAPIYANENERPPSQKEIQKELDHAQQEFDEAKKMFNPWYAGPLLTGSAHVMPMGSFNIQPYLFVTTNFAQYDSNRKSQNIPNLLQVNIPVILQTGIFPGIDLSVVPQYLHNQQSSKSYDYVGDTSLQFGFQLLQETPYLPAIKLGISPSIPTGKYKWLNPSRLGLDATGSGSYSTQFSLNFSKVVWWLMLHPMAFRLSLNYKYSPKVHVRDFNSYGGGYGTDGKVKPGDNVTTNFAVEYSFTQNWVFATDFSYVYNKKSTFTGNPGTDATGATASVGSPQSDQFSIAPAIEYNPAPTLGFLAGVWFTATGKNSFNFVSGILTMTAGF